jgi:hypothetical protein
MCLVSQATHGSSHLLIKIVHAALHGNNDQQKVFSMSWCNLFQPGQVEKDLVNAN